VTSSLWVAAYLKKVRFQNGFAYLIKRGDEEAGSIFIHLDHGQGLESLIGPAPQSSYSQDHVQAGTRLFVPLVLRSMQVEGQCASRLQKEQRFDDDCWIIGVEHSELHAFLGEQLVE
jgi:hypothetical protein